jgi:hypothetical protein
MKALIILFFSFSAFACLNPLDRSKMGALISNGPESVSLRCDGSDCTCLDGLNPRAIKSKVDMVDDYTKPLHEPESEVEVCEGEEECRELLSKKVCPDLKYINSDYTEIYCTAFIGYDKKEELNLENDPAKLAAIEASREAKEAKKAQRAQSQSDALTALKNLSKSEFDALTANQKNLVLWRTLQIVLKDAD